MSPLRSGSAPNGRSPTHCYTSSCKELSGKAWEATAFSEVRARSLYSRTWKYFKYLGQTYLTNYLKRGRGLRFGYRYNAKEEVMAPCITILGGTASSAVISWRSFCKVA